MTLLVESLDLTLSNKTIVKNVDLNVKPGEVVGLLGPNGAGKTSTFNLIMGLIKPNKGNIFLEGNSIKKFSMTRRYCLYLALSSP
jgi:lipopolysaccharide export system ATP-binding protein